MDTTHVTQSIGPDATHRTAKLQRLWSLNFSSCEKMLGGYQTGCMSCEFIAEAETDTSHQANADWLWLQLSFFVQCWSVLSILTRQSAKIKTHWRLRTARATRTLVWVLIHLYNVTPHPKNTCRFFLCLSQSLYFIQRVYLIWRAWTLCTFCGLPAVVVSWRKRKFPVNALSAYDTQEWSVSH